MGITLTDVLLFGKAQSDDVDSAAFAIMRRNILRWGAIGGYVSIVVHGVSPLVLPDAIARSLSYVKAFGGTEQRNIPEGYTQLEYIESSGTQYIDTGLKLTQDNTVEVEYNYHTASNIATSGRMFGARYTSSPKRSFSLGSNSGYASSTTNTFAQLGNDDRLATNNITIGQWGVYKISADGFYIDGVLQGSFPATTFETPFTVKLFAFEQASSSSGTPTVGGGVGRCRRFKVYQGDTLVMDLIPAKNPTNDIGMYDLVSGQFFTNQGTGSFVAGPAAVPTPDTPIDIVSNNGVLKARHQSGLPLGYTQVEYLQTDGNSYIDTGIAVPTTYKWELTLNSRGTNTSPYWGYSKTNSYSSATSFYSLDANGGTGVSGIALSIGAYSGTPETSQQSFYNATQITNAGTLGGDAPHTIKCNGSFVFTADDTPMTQVISKTFTDFTPTGNAYLFARHTPSISKAGDGARIYAYKVWNASGVLVQNLIPCKNSSNVAGFYDTVSGNFLTNQGTGTFTAGSTVSDPVEIYTDGTVETINAHGKNLFNQALFDTDVASTITYTTFEISNGTYTMSTNFPYAGGATNVFIFAGKVTSGAATTTNGVYDGQSRTITVTNGKYTVAYRSRTSASSNPNNPKYYDFQLELGSTATTYQPYFDGGAATAEMLLKVGDYQDVQSIIDGAITRNVGVKVLDGTEDYWTTGSDIPHGTWATSTISGIATDTEKAYCTHFANSPRNNPAPKTFCLRVNSNGYLFNLDGIGTTLSDWKTWLVTQYTAGTPVIVIYPLATPTTESVVGQHLQVTDGDNVLEITQAGLTGLELEAQYNAAVSLTIQEVQDANLDNNVTVTIQ